MQDDSCSSFTTTSSSRRSGSALKRKSDLIGSEFKQTLLSSQTKSPNEDDGFTINKLRISSLSLHGREKETAVLQNCLDRLTADESQRELVWIRGPSGTGKSSLCESVASQVKQKRGAFVSGKFDLYLRDEPYSGIIDACEELCHLVLDKQAEEQNGLLEDIRTRLDYQLGHEISVLVDIIPSVQRLMGSEFQRRNSDPSMRKSDEARSQQIDYAFRIFMRIMSSCFGPLVFALDDLQWADMASLELIQTIISDYQNSRFMIIGCYRSNEVGENHALSKVITHLGEQDESGHFTSFVDLGNLGVEECNKAVMELLSIDDDKKTIRLTQICHQKTLGNPFFLIQFMFSLKEEGFLEFDLSTFKWRWDETVIKEKTTVAENIVEVVKERMEKLPKQLLHFLQIAACIGSAFSRRMISIAWENVPSQGTEKDVGSRETVDSMLEMALSGYFIEGHGPFRWLHDKIQEAAMQLVGADPSEIKFRIGMSLYKELSKDELSSELFVVVNLLNALDMDQTTEDDRKAVFDLNLQAAEKAKSFSAFQSAAMYARRGIKMLPPNSWDTHPDQTLRLYSVGAEACGFLGNINEMELNCSAVLSQTKLNIFDKLRAYNVQITTKGNFVSAHDASDLGFSVLSQLGCHFPRTSVTRMFLALPTILSHRRNPPKAEDIKKLPIMTDSTKKECMKLLFQLQGLLYYTQNWSLYTLLNARMIKWTMKYGLSEYSSTGLIGLGVLILAVLGDFEIGLIYADAAVLTTKLLSDGTKKLAGESRECFAVATLSSWKKPIRNVMKTLPDGYRVGMQIGDTESALWCVGHNLFMQLIVGYPLEKVDADCRLYIVQMKDLKQMEHFWFVCPIWQAAINLIGNSQHRTTMVGEAFRDAEDEETALCMMQGHTPAQRNFEMVKNALYTYFGEYEKGAELAISRGCSYLRDLPIMPAGMWDLLFMGICLFATACISKKQKYTVLAIKIRSKVHDWLKQGNPNVRHHAAFLDAEYCVYRKEYDKAAKCYEDAIANASRGGFVHDAALANERCALFLLSKVADHNGASFRINESLKAYTDWGAKAKVAALQETYKDLLETPI